VADDDDRLASSCYDGAQGGCVRSRGQPLVGLRLGAERTAELRRGLAGTEERTGEDGIRPKSVRGEAVSELAGSGSTVGRQRSELVGLTRGCLGVTDEVDAHSARIRGGP